MMAEPTQETEVTEVAEAPKPKPNKDGLIPGEPVDFETLQKVRKKHAEAARKAGK